MDNYGKILGGLLAAAVGDAMGAATETRSTAQIIERFGGLVKDFITPPDDVFARGFAKGSVTDDFSLAYCTALAILDNEGKVTDEVAKNALINWSRTPYYVLAGPTTIKAVERMLGHEVEEKQSFIKYDSSKGSDGGAMKISPVGLLSGGNVDKAIEDAITICRPTHFNSTALSGACAVAAAVAEALNENATVDSVIEAGMKGALKGETVAKEAGKELANPSVYKRIALAVEIAKKCNGDMGKAMQELADIIGAGLSASETVPCAFGILKAAEGDTMKTIIAGVNIGNDTDTVATIAAAMAGTLESFYNEDYLKLINEVNSYDLEDTARRIAQVSNG
ncbi:MAG: ADP-ribosylglycohydrolase family protein [Erysipelotrichaceae bacterium]|nr:ADP-ribosylglycohydrolase family protein [Erysipelotrichaceae bacterium]